MTRKRAAAFFIALLFLLLAGCAGLPAPPALPPGARAELLFTAPAGCSLREVRFAPDHKRFLAFMETRDRRMRAAGEASGEWAFAGFCEPRTGMEEESPFRPDGGAAFVTGDGERFRVNYEGLSGAAYNEVAGLSFTAVGLCYAAREGKDWYVVRAMPGQGALFEERDGPYSERPVFAAVDRLFTVLQPGPLVRVEGGSFSFVIPLSAMSENVGLPVGVPDRVTAASREGFSAVCMGAGAASPGALNAFIVTVTEAGGNQIRFAPFPGFDRMAGVPVFSADLARVAFVAEKEGKERLVVADLVNPSFGVGPGFPRVLFPVFSPKTVEGACVVFDGQKYFLMEGDDLKSEGYEAMGRPVFSADGAHLAVAARADGLWRILADGKVSPPLKSGKPENLAFSEDGKSIEFNAVCGRGLYRFTYSWGGS